KSLHFLSSFTNRSRLQTLELEVNQFDGVLPNSISNLSNELIELYFGNNEISGTIPESLTNLVNLIILGLNDNHFIGVIPIAFGKFEKMQSLGIPNLCQMDPNVHKFLVSILEIGLACSMESPKDRMKMKEVTRELHLIKNAFLGTAIRRCEFRRIQFDNYNKEEWRFEDITNHEPFAYVNKFYYLFYVTQIIYYSFF
ncbi:lrr receptor-like serine/threonine-protein kinase efr, partial [Quercus suber]